ncbi:GyrI-like domain-containing protein [Rothia sp. P7181]|uniref:GyrI-like domain-containing protein n=1 Tax=unclassified Rothia (in: high G+C Gram-positive bacteria) TaxID=2689056 RepID=UPI003AED2FA5
MMSDFARVEHRPSLVLAGLRETIDPAVGNADVWERVLNTVKLAGFSTEGTQQVAIIFGANMRQEFDYMAGLVVNSRDNAQALGLNAAEVPAGDYAIVDVRGPAPLASMTGLDYLLGTFLPERALTASGPAMEVYGPGDTSSEDYMMQVWVPVKAL